MDLLELPRTNIKAYTMPGFATSDKTYASATALMKSLGVESNEIDIRASCLQMFKDIGHPFAQEEKVYDITFENVQAGERTSHLFRIANLRNALVVGTGDLSELALGWCTYGVGDHMSHYNVNASVPKTLIQYLIRWVARSGQFDSETSDILIGILETEISPELIPGQKWRPAGTGNGRDYRSLRAAGFQQLLYYAIRICSHKDCLHGILRVERQRERPLARCPGTQKNTIYYRRD